jgi:LysM repeat protein
MSRPPHILGRFSWLAALSLASVQVAAAQSLIGSPVSLDAQNRIARAHDFSYLATGTQVRQFVRSGYLVPVESNDDFDLHAVSFPYARPEVEVFVRRLASQYRSACGEKLVVTSLTRPLNMQPRNASDRSVHPTGMAVDMRRSSKASCRAWLEEILLALENAEVLEATRERYPPHYHVALFPRQYASYVDGVVATRALASASSPDVDLRKVEYRVRSGDSLWTIARRLGTTVERLKNENGLDSSRIYAGQVIEVPVTN